MLAAQSLREHIQQFLGGAVSLDDFEDWLVAASWNMHLRAGADVQRMVGAVELRLAEHSNGHLDVADLKHEFQMLLMYGCQPTAMQMPIFVIDLPLPATVSSTVPQSANIQSVVVAVDRIVSSQTRSASPRSMSAPEALAAGSS